jgi:hypothetical protein
MSQNRRIFQTLSEEWKFRIMEIIMDMVFEISASKKLKTTDNILP